jgi:arachidonate 15-lipoxygenase (second type) / 8-lipoxygenase (S-type)
LDDYAKVLYQDQWKNSNPRGVAPGIMTNYTQDLLFSMERLSQNPYPLKAVLPTDDLPFELEDDLTNKIAGTTLEDLKTTGKLFYVDRKWRLSISHSAPRTRLT